MSLARRRKRRIVVGGYTWWYRADFSYDQLWTDGGGMLIVRDDRKVQLWLTAPGRGNVNRCLARVVAPTLPWFASQPKFTAYEVPLNIAPGWTPGVVAKVIAWCLDATAERVAVPSPWLVAPALPDERTVEGFVARLLNPSGRDLQRAVEVAEEVLDRPLIARPLDPVARDLRARADSSPASGRRLPFGESSPMTGRVTRRGASSLLWSVRLRANP